MTYAKWKTERWRGRTFCVHCGNGSKITVLLEQPWVETTLVEFVDGSREDEWVWMLSVARCHMCNGVLVHQTGWDQYSAAVRAKVLPLEYLVWPHNGGLQYPVPQRIRELYASALSLKARSPDAFVVQIRRALEAVCQDRGQHGSLSAMLRSLKDSGVIPATLSAIADAVRLIGNSGAHTGPVVSAFDATQADAFFRMVVEYVYGAPYLLEMFERSRRVES